MVADISRRKILHSGLVLAGSALLTPLVGNAALASFAPPRLATNKLESERILSFNNTHTGEKCRVAYWEKGKYIHGAMREIDRVLRDHRTGEARAMDPALFDLLHKLQLRLESKAPFQVISGYRSPKSNAKMHENSSGVAKKSLHMQGKAIDIRLADKSINNIRNAALSLKKGGVGFYPESQFVHIDTGKVRHWG